jgi:hypothetical protein
MRKLSKKHCSKYFFLQKGKTNNLLITFSTISLANQKRRKTRIGLDKSLPFGLLETT